MLNNINYSTMINNAKLQGKSHVDLSRASVLANSNSTVVEKDTVTLSDRALALHEGKSVEKVSPIYSRPETAAELLKANQSKEDVQLAEKANRSEKFAEVMQNILDQRLGIDREKLEEIEAMIEEVAKNENLSPDEKEKLIEQLEEMKEEIVQESIEDQKFVKANDKNNNE